MSVSLDAPVDDSLTRSALDRHQLRRAQGVPTLSVLVGDAKASTEAWRRWSTGYGPTRIARWPQAADDLTLFTGEIVLFMNDPSADGERNARGVWRMRSDI